MDSHSGQFTPYLRLVSVFALLAAFALPVIQAEPVAAASAQGKPGDLAQEQIAGF